MRLRNRILCGVFGLSAAACGDRASSTVTLTQSNAVNKIQITPSALTLETGTTATLSAVSLDQAGNALTTKSVTWNSSNTASLTVDAATGVVHGVAVGSGLITATSEGKSASIAAVVTAPSVASIAVSAPATTVSAGEQEKLVVTVVDKTGATVTSKTVTWASSNPRVATIDANGLVTTFSAGTATITATSDGVNGSVSLTVNAPAGAVAPYISSVSPATLTPGSTVTIAGTNFIAGSAKNLVFVGGVQATVISATPSQIVATVASSYACQSTQAVPVEVTTAGGVASSSKTLVVGTTRTLAVGESFLATDATSRGCNELPASGSYIVSVFNASTTSASTSDVELKGTGGTSGILASRIASTASLAPAIVSAPASSYLHAVDPVRAALAREHEAHQQLNRAVLQRLGSPRGYKKAVHAQYSNLSSASSAQYATGTTASSTPSALETVPTTVGATAHLNFYYTNCSASAATKVSARVVYVGPKAIVLEDNNAPLAGKTDADLITMAKEWENVSYPLLVKNFGDPLAYDKQTDNNGRIIMMFTPLVNNVSSGLLGFVWSCDFYPPTADKSVAASNQAEIFYARVITDTSASGTSVNSRSGWKRQMPATLAHESKHIASFAERNATPVVANDEETWLEEATAQLEAELYSRSLHGNTWLGNAAYTGVIDCEFRPTDPSCGGAILGIYNNFSWLEDYETSFETSSILSEDYASIYGGAWMFTRWVTDTYGGGNEGNFTSSIVKNYDSYGVANVVQRSGKTWAELFSQFTLMLAADEVAGVKAPYVEPSWNLPAIFTGFGTLSKSFSANPLSTRSATFGNFSASVSALKGGSAMLVRLGGSATGGTQLLDLHGASGSALAAAAKVGIAVLRVQ